MKRLGASALGSAVVLLCHVASAGPPAPNGLELGARVAWNTNDQGSFALVGLRVGGRVVPHVGLGGYVDVVPFGPSLRCAPCGPEADRPLRLGGYFDFHVLPHRVVDPWARFGLGLVRTGRSAADVELALGLDFRGRRVAGGPFVMWVIPLDDQQPRNWVGVGAQVSVSF